MCSINSSNEQENLEQVIVKKDPLFRDLQLNIIDYRQDEEKNHICLIKGLWNGEIVGFEISFKPNMKPKEFYEEGIIFHSIGDISNNFIKLLAKLYKVRLKKRVMLDKIVTVSYALNGNPSFFTSEYIRMKLFLDHSNKNKAYSELFIIVDFKNKTLGFDEKNTGYRKNLIKAMTRKK